MAMSWRAFVICSALAAMLWIAAPLAHGEQPWRCADFDRDGAVSVEEIEQVVAHFGTFAGAERYGYGLGYHPRYDLNRDQRVDLSDILIAVRQHFLGCEDAQP